MGAIQGVVQSVPHGQSRLLHDYADDDELMHGFVNLAVHLCPHAEHTWLIVRVPGHVSIRQDACTCDRTWKHCRSYRSSQRAVLAVLLLGHCQDLPEGELESTSRGYPSTVLTRRLGSGVHCGGASSGLPYFNTSVVSILPARSQASLGSSTW